MNINEKKILKCLQHTVGLACVSQLVFTFISIVSYHNSESHDSKLKRNMSVLFIDGFMSLILSRVYIKEDNQCGASECAGVIPRWFIKFCFPFKAEGRRDNNKIVIVPQFAVAAVAYAMLGAASWNGERYSALSKLSLVWVMACICIYSACTSQHNRVVDGNMPEDVTVQSGRSLAAVV